MSDSYKTIETLGELFVHALELEHESAERYRQLARSMEIHHNQEVAALFERLAIIGEQHARTVEDRASGLALPKIAPWEFKWACPDSPESHCLELDATYLMTAPRALEIALHNEIRGRDFYAHVARSSSSRAVRENAGEMAEEESAHVSLLEEWLRRETEARQPDPLDLDPPNVPG
ncbi:MAG: ferritin family protein [Chromatiaceae bacterium]|nr:ferritin family protein [Chromatiaceae bacterium]